MAGFPYIYTFYSFKGGVGRSMAVLNTAYALAGWGKHVLILDMDLEAPGVSGFLERNDELVKPAKGARQLDVLTLLGEAVGGARQGMTPEEIVPLIPPLPNYLRSVVVEKLAPLRSRIGEVGRVDVVAANFDEQWGRRLAELDLASLSREQLIGASMALNIYLKAARFSHRPPGLEDFEEPLSTPYDYILVDSRTGITEVGGLCVGPLADRLIVISGLNDQNIRGTLGFLKEAGIKPERRSPESKIWDQADLPADPEVPTLGPKPTLLVASPVPNGEIEAKKRRLLELEATIGIPPVRLSYHPQMALMETIFVRDHQDEYLAGEYLHLAGLMTRQANDHPAQISARILKDRESAMKTKETGGDLLRLTAQQPDSGVSLMGQFLDDFEAEDDEGYLLKRRIFAVLMRVGYILDELLMGWGNALLAQAERKTGAEADTLFAEAGGKYARAVEIKPDKDEAFYNWGNALFTQARGKSGTEADALFAEAGGKYSRAVEIKPNRDEAFNNWGNVLLAQAERKSGAEADTLFAEAGGKYARAVEIKPDKDEAFYNWGNALSTQARGKSGTEADALFAEAGGKYSRALEIKPDDHEAFYNWGNALSTQARGKSGTEADALFAEAGGKYARAVEIKPDKDEAFYNWGNALLTQARGKSGAEADALFAEARGKYARAVEIKPDDHEVFYNWGVALSTQARRKSGAEADALFAEASGKYARAVEIWPNKNETFYNWGASLIERAKLKPEEARMELYSEAREKLMKAEELSKGAGAFNLACLAALLGDAAESVGWLEVLQSSGTVTKEKIEGESDFDAVREDPVFRAFMDTLLPSQTD